MCYRSLVLSIQCFFLDFTPNVVPIFDAFSDLLIQEEVKLIQMGLIQVSNSQELVGSEPKVQKESGNLDQKQKKKKNKPRKEFESSSSKGESFKREKPTCAYCKKSGHDEHQCYLKQIDELKNLLAKNKIDLTSTILKDSPSSSKPKLEKQKGKSLVAIADSESRRWIPDSRASHHMASSQSMLSSFETCSSPNILMVNNTHMCVCGKGSIDIDE